MNSEIILRKISQDEIDIPVEWAREEGWNPGLHDAQCHYAVDPEGWFCAEKEGEIIGVAVVTNYNDTFSFGGFYIIKEPFRNKGVGWDLSRLALAHRGERNLGIDGVYEMQEKYANRDGMIYAYRNIRWEGIADGKEQPGLKTLTEVPFDDLLAYDTTHFPAERRTFLQAWIHQPDSWGYAKVSHEGLIQGYGVIRKCFEGYKIGPIFADSPAIAEELYEGLTARIIGETVFFDTPEPNKNAVQMAMKRNMTEVFGTARMYSREIPPLPIHEIFGVTTFELG